VAHPLSMVGTEAQDFAGRYVDGVMDRRQRRFLAWLTALSALCMVAQALTGVAELTLYLTPLFLIAALLLSGHYVAEDAIVRGWLGKRPRPARRRSTPRVAIPAARPLTDLLERSPLSRRGPPALALHSA
jgi:hypothetical protein